MKVTIGTIQQAYRRLWLAFVDAASSQTLGAESVGSGAVVTQVGNDVTATAVVFLPAWPYKAVSGKRSVDIAVNVSEIFSDDLTTVTRATTNVGYFLRDIGADPPTSRPILEMHYDFETPAREAHPLFHAQIGSNNWDAEKLKKLGMIASIERDASEKHYANARIPTAYVGFATILVALAADHLKPRSFRKMMEAARQVDAGNLNPAYTVLLDNLVPNGSVPHAHHWYDERYVVHIWRDTRSKKFKAKVPVLEEEYTEKDERSVKAHVALKLGVAVTKIRFVDGPP